LPKRIIIVGGGYIAVEFAGIFNGFGSEVIEIIRRQDVLRGFDEGIRIYLGEEMRGRGIDIRSNAQVARIDETAGGYVVTTTAGDRIDTDLVMYATGRAPNTDGLGLAEIGVELTANGAIIVDEWQRSPKVPNIYAIGDVTDRINLTPVAIAEGRAIAETLYNGNPIKMVPVNCGPGTFQILNVFTGTADTQSCANVSGVTNYYTFTWPPNSAYDYVLCLKKQ